MQHHPRFLVACVLAASGALVFACEGEKKDSPAPAASSAAVTVAPKPSVSAQPIIEKAAATASASASASTGIEAAKNAPPLTVVAMKLVMPKSKPLEIKDDGSVVYDGQTMGKFVGADFVDKDGKVIMSVAADGSLVSPVGDPKPAKFNDKDELEVGGGKLFVGDDGVVKLTKPDGKPDDESGKAKFTGFKPAARRAATMVLVIMLARPEPVPSPATATSGVIAAPSASAKKN